MTEHDIQNSIRLELSKQGVVMFRVNVGTVKMPDGRYFSTGLPNGFSDLFGIIPETGQAVFVEVKKPGGKRAAEQKKFIARMKQQGARAGFAETVEDALEIAGLLYVMGMTRR